MIKYLSLLAFNLLVRMAPRPPNFEPVMSTTMPLGRKYGGLWAGTFAFLSIFLFDLLHGTPGYPRIGVWTFVTAGTYFAIGVAAGRYFRQRRGVRHYVGFSVVATLLYDFITGPVMSSAVWKMPFLLSLVGQVPFTLWHLAGNAGGALLISPLVERWLEGLPRREVVANADGQF